MTVLRACNDQDGVGPPDFAALRVLCAIPALKRKRTNARALQRYSYGARARHLTRVREYTYFMKAERRAAALDASRQILFYATCFLFLYFLFFFSAARLFWLELLN